MSFPILVVLARIGSTRAVASECDRFTLEGLYLSFIALHTRGQHLVGSRLILPPIMASQQLWTFNLAQITFILVLCSH